MGKNTSAGFLNIHSVWLVPLLILITAISIRVIYLNQISSLPTFEHPIMDEKYHVELAEQINSESGLPAEPFYRAPFYPYFLAFLYNSTDDSIYWTRLIQLIIGSFLPLFIYALSLRLFNRKVAVWSGFIAAFYPTLIFFEASLLIESIMGLLTVLLIWQLYRCERTLSVLDFVLAGIILGLAGLARPNILMLGPFLFIWIYLIIKPKLGWPKSILRFALIGLGSLIVILPITIRNKTVGNDSVFIAWQGGFNFYLGNNQMASGWSATVEGIDYSWEGGYNQSIALAEKVEGRTLKFSEISDFWYAQAWKEILADPGHFIALQFKKIRLLINGFEIPNNQSTYFAREFSWILKPLLFNKIIFFPFGILAPLAIIGIAFSVQHWRQYLLMYLIVFSWSITLLMFFVCDRYRQPLIPFLFPFAVYGIYQLVAMYKKRDKKNLSLILFFLFLLLLESNHLVAEITPRQLQANDYYLIGLAELDMGNLSGAEREFNKALEFDPLYGSAYNNLGMISVRRGDINAAAKHFLKAIEVEPYSIEPYLNYSTFLIERQIYDAALDVLLRARQIQPLNDLVHLKLGLTLYQLDRKDEAIKAVEESLRLNPNNESAKEVYVRIKQELDN